MTAMVKQVETSETGKKTTQVVTCAERTSPQQDSCWSWLVCFAGVVSNVIICGFTFSYGILFPALLDEFQQGKAKTGIVSLLLLCYVTSTFLLVSSSVQSKQLLCFVHRQGQKSEQKPTTKNIAGFHNHSLY